MKYFSILLSMATLSSYALPTYLSSDPGFFISPRNNVQLGAGFTPGNIKRSRNGTWLMSGKTFSVWGEGFYVMQSKIFSAHPTFGGFLQYSVDEESSSSNVRLAINQAYGITTAPATVASILQTKQKQYSIGPSIGFQYPITDHLLIHFDFNPVLFTRSKTIQPSANIVTTREFDYNKLSLRFLYQLV